ncbi:MAG TPA: ferritin-like domain-containing protein [Pseudoxanthomonas sp.]|nr:ferritin-like domain-containing protein [Pseudoxanthomonas sp.]
MDKDTRLGANRTGMKASPFDSSEMLEALDLQVEIPQPDIDLAALRTGYRATTGTVGSMPPPTNIKGIFGAVTQALSGHRMHVLLDKLGERAAYERTGTRLYDAAIIQLSNSTLPADMDMAALQQIRDDEAGHFNMLAEAIEQLGGDPTAQTPCADVTGVQGLGLIQAMGDPRITPPQVLQILLSAEVVDVVSWELLIELCDGFGLTEISTRFQAALDAENRHLLTVRGWLSAALSESGLGESGEEAQA